MREGGPGQVAEIGACRQLLGRSEEAPERPERTHEGSEVSVILIQGIPKWTETCQREMSQVTDERHLFPHDGDLVVQEASWHTGVTFTVKADKAGSSTVTWTQLKGRDEWLEQVGSQPLERSMCLGRWGCPRGGASKDIAGRIAHLVSSPKGIGCLSVAARKGCYTPWNWS